MAENDSTLYSLNDNTIVFKEKGASELSYSNVSDFKNNIILT